jgi:hypothetical protein
LKDEVQAASSSLLNEKEGDDVSWADTNFIGPKNEENPHDQFS